MRQPPKSDSLCAALKLRSRRWLWALLPLLWPANRKRCALLLSTCLLPACRATYGGPAIDGMTFYVDPPTEAFQAAAEHCMQHRFEPRLKVGLLLGRGRPAGLKAADQQQPLLPG